MEIVGCGSSLVIVACPWASAMVAFVALLRLMKKVSSGSKVLSAMMLLEMVFVIVPGSRIPRTLKRSGGSRYLPSPCRLRVQTER